MTSAVPNVEEDTDAIDVALQNDKSSSAVIQVLAKTAGYSENKGQ